MKTLLLSVPRMRQEDHTRCSIRNTPTQPSNIREWPGIQQEATEIKKMSWKPRNLWSRKSSTHTHTWKNHSYWHCFQWSIILPEQTTVLKFFLLIICVHSTMYAKTIALIIYECFGNHISLLFSSRCSLPSCGTRRGQIPSEEWQSHKLVFVKKCWKNSQEKKNLGSDFSKCSICSTSKWLRYWKKNVFSIKWLLSANWLDRSSEAFRFWNELKIVSCTDLLQLRMNKHSAFYDNFNWSNSIGSYSVIA